MSNDTQTNSNEATLDVTAVAKDLGVSRITVLRWGRAGKLPGFFRIGKKWLIRKADYEQFINRRITQGETI